MALRSNGYQFASSGVWHTGVAASLSAIPGVLHGNRWQTGRIRNLTAGEGITSELVGIPLGYRNGSAWMMPQKAGAISARNTIIGSGNATGTGQSGYNIAGTITGAGGIPGCDIGLIVSIAATLLASGGVSSAQVDALASMVASLTGSGDIAATAAGLADLASVLTGTGTVSAGNTALMDIAATIVGYGELTPEGLRDAVWNAIATSYNESGTMGEKLNASGSASNPWIEVIESGLTAAEILRLIAAAVQGNATGLENGSPVFKSIDGATDRITATYASGTRTVTGRDGS